jgi:O-acetyl-ADP-ribose deacetylase (regulator of RNase III)
MFKEIEGDLIQMTDEGLFDVIAQGCNCFQVQGAGLALSLKRRWPVVYEVDRETLRAYEGKLGTISIATVETDSGTANVINCYSQFRYGKGQQFAEYGAIRSCMMKIKQQFGNKRIGLPKIGCNLAGGKWSIVKKIMMEELAGSDVTFVTYKNET